MIQPGLSTIALNVGSTSIKGAVLDLETGQLLSKAERPFPDPIGNLPVGHMEFDPKVIVSRVLEVIDELSGQLSQRCWLWICGQMGGLVLADERGRAKSNYLSWQDQRSIQSSGGVRSSMETIRLDWTEGHFASLGRELQPGSTSTLLHWLSEHRKLSDGVLPMSIADYCISHLAKQPATMHATHAIGLLDLSKWDWNYAALERIGLGDLWWPELIRGTPAVAQCRIGSRVYQVHGSYGDQQCALFGAGLEPGQLSIHLSTDAQVSAIASTLESGPFQTRAYFGEYLLKTITHLPVDRAWEAAPEEFAPEEVHWIETIETCYRASKRFGDMGRWGSGLMTGVLPSRFPNMVRLFEDRFRLPMVQRSGEQSLLGLLRLAQQHQGSR